VPAWKPAGLDAVNSITCVGHGWCFATDPFGNVHATHDAGRPRSWSRAFHDHVLSDPTGRFSCPSTRLCVAVDALGRVATGRGAQKRR
jgi:hypothetical protein